MNNKHPDCEIHKRIRRRRHNARRREYGDKLREFRNSISLKPQATYILYDEKNKLYVTESFEIKHCKKVINTSHCGKICLTGNKKYAHKFQYKMVLDNIHKYLFNLKGTGAWRPIRVSN